MYKIFNLNNKLGNAIQAGLYVILYLILCDKKIGRKRFTNETIYHCFQKSTE